MYNDGLWQVTFEVAANPPGELLAALEDMASSVSIFECDSDDHARTTRWRVELLLEDAPNPEDQERQLDELLAPMGLKASGIKIGFLRHEDWLALASMPREPLRLGRFIVHGKDHRIDPPPRAIPLLIDAGMAFGSGEHGSTSGCLLAFDRLLRRHRFANVLDMGCGSAILGIAAAKAYRQQRRSGAARGCRVLVSDNDPLAVNVAGTNAAINGVSTVVRTLCAEGYAHPTIKRAAPFDLIFANILADPLIAMAGDLKRHLARGGFAILAGLLDRQADAVIAAHRRHGLRLVHQFDLSPWRTLVLKRTASGAQGNAGRALGRGPALIRGASGLIHPA